MKARAGTPKLSTQLEKARQLEPSQSECLQRTWRGVQKRWVRRPSSATRNRTTRRRPNWRPGDWASLNALGGYYYRRGRYLGRHSALSTDHPFAPGNSQGYTNLGATYDMLGQNESAAVSFKQSLSLRPTASAYSNLGTVYFFLGRCAEAVPLMERASQLTPKSEQVWGNLGDAYACVSGRKGDADSAYRHAVQLGQDRLAL